MTLWQPGMRITAARLNAGVDPTIVTTGATASSGFTLTTFVGYKIGPLVSIYVLANVTTAVTASGGNINDTNFVTLPSGYRPLDPVDCCFGNGSMDGEALIDPSSGLITLRSANATISATSNVRLAATFVAATST